MPQVCDNSCAFRKFTAMSIDSKVNSFSRPRRRESGLSLVELMVALALGLVIVAALAELFVNISRTNLEMAKTNSQIENARFAMQFLGNDIVHAGFWDGFVPEFDDFSFSEDPDDFPGNLPDPCLAYSAANWTDDFQQSLVGLPIEVYTGAGLPGSCDGVIGDDADKVAGTDVLIVRHSHTCVPGGDCDDTGSTSKQLYFQASNCAGEIDAGNPFVFDPNSPPLLDKSCTTIKAPKRKFVQSIYYVRDYSNEDSSGNKLDSIPTLVRSEFGVTGTTPTQQEAVALVEGIEMFRVELGIDNVSESGFPLDPNDFTKKIDWEDEDNWAEAENRGDGTPDEYVHCPASRCSILELANAVTAKVYVLARATEPTPGYEDTKTYAMGTSGPIPAFNDAYKRHVFFTTVRLNNVSGRRETP